MQIQDFNIIKERQQKEINTAIQTVKSNPFSQEIKDRFIGLGEKVINGINAQRSHIYKELEDFDFEDKYDHTADHHTSANVTHVNEGVLDTRPIQHKISESLSKIINELSSENAASITGPTNNKLQNTKQQFDQFNGAVIGDLKEMISLVSNAYQEPVEEEETKEEDGGDLDTEALKSQNNPPAEKEVEHELTAEDFDNNPDLAKEGLNIGDKITVSFMEEKQKAFNEQETGGEKEKEQTKEQEKETYFPQGGATAINKEELEEGNKKENKSRKKGK